MVKKFIIGILLLLLAAMGGLYLSLPSFVDKEAIKNQFLSSFKAATGLDVEISGDVVVESFPSPHVVINSVYVHNAPGGLSQFLMSINLVNIWPTYTSFFGKRMNIGKINLDTVDIELEQLKNGQMNWADPTVRTSAPMSFAGLSAESTGLVGTTITLTNGYVHYVDAVTSTSNEYKDISVALLNGGAQADSTMKIDFRYRDRAFDIAGKIGNIQHALSVGEMPANLNISSGKTMLNYDGSAGYRDGKLSIGGKMKFTTDDIGSWINTIMGSDKQVTATDAESETDNSGGYKLLPLEFASDITTENGKIVLPAVTLEGTIIKGGMHVEIDPDALSMDVKASINTLDLETLFSSKFFSYKEKVEETGGLGDLIRSERHVAPKEQAPIITQKSFYNSLGISADVKLEDTIYNGQHIKDAHIQFDSVGGDVTISQATATLPGNTRTVFAGIGKEGFQGFTLEGELDATGDDFTEAMKVMKANGAAIPVQDFKRFRLKANATLSPVEFRLSELTMRIEGMTFIGGIIATFGDRIKLNAAMRISGVNLDHFVQVWGLQEWRTSLFDTTPGAKYESFLQHWLRKLDYDARMNVAFEQFTLNGVLRDKADFKLTATSGNVMLDDFSTVYNGTQIAGSFALDVNSTLPKIALKATLDTFDMSTFFTPDGKALPVPPEQHPVTVAERWPRKEFDFHWLELLNVVFDLKFGQYKQGLIQAEKLHVHGMIDEHGLTVDSLTGTILGAPTAGRVSIVGGKIPSITLAANVRGLDSTRLLPFLPVLAGMTGKYNLSLRLDTSGIDMFSWVSSLEGSVGVGGEHVNIHGFNLAGVIHAVTYVRTVADILNVVRRAFPGGDTVFSSIEGQWTVVGGVLKTSNSRLNNEQANGLLSSQVDLVNWQTQTVISLGLKTLDPAHPPGMVITFSGSIDHPDIALDTRSLEQYVTNLTSQQMLQQYGTH